MKIKPGRHQIRAILFWSIVILIAPFAVEVVMLAELAGAEFAIGFLLLYLKQSMLQLRERLLRLKATLTNVAGLLNSHIVFNERVFYPHAGLSLTVVAIGAPLLYVALIWYPVIAAGSWT
ncbi:MULTISPECIES: hypothetical protein [Microbulbifer]|uniref:hypothetical protein n=1 Tax=Microbulbifer TaxID=48073 RepID=UPI001E2C800B|nr:MULTISPECIES: hypothetical protein [Microbulbifer]UHQ53693.1 hypothetical protein LVE68_09210 [Microbulbifer sp. YPW16]